ncbi:MAG: Holliday junction resolvase RuvX [Actinomycetota bacterium]|nr:Holliday junction resolvase RuvX [Actinomycetota bacterium]
MRLMSLDIGDKNIGVAISKKDIKMAIPHSVLPHDHMIAESLKKIIDEHKIEKIIVGIPFNLKGEIGYQGKKVIDFIDKYIKPHGLPIVQYDERFSTKLCEFKNKKDKTKQIDKYSACVILNDYITRYEK